jgi:hypothetical protein
MSPTLEATVIDGVVLAPAVAVVRVGAPVEPV